MRSQLRLVLPLVWAVLFLAQPAQAGAQEKEKVYRSVSPTQIEDSLSALGITFRKSQPEKLPEDYAYNFEHNGYKVLLTTSKGKLLWISASFQRVPLEKINQWNVNAKFSRAILNRVNDQEFSVVEWQEDAGGGVTDNMIRQFIRRFNDEVANFANFVARP